MQSYGKGKLKILATLMDRITAVGSRCPDLNATDLLDRRRIEECRQTLLTWWDLAKESFALSADHVGDSKFWRLLLGPYQLNWKNGRSVPDLESVADGRPAIELALPPLRRWLQTGDRPSDEDKNFSKHFFSLCKTVADAVFFATLGGCGGLTQAAPHVGDHVAFLGNSGAPFVVREAGKSTGYDAYKVVAVCYCKKLVDPIGESHDVPVAQNPPIDGAEDILDLLAAPGVHNSNAFASAVRECRLRDNGPEDALDHWHPVRGALFRDHGLELTAVYCADDHPQTVAQMLEQVHEDMRWVEGPASANATQESLLRPQLSIEPASIACYCRLALTHYEGAVIACNPVTLTSVQSRFAAIAVDLICTVLARGYLTYLGYLASQHTPTPAAGPSNAASTTDAELARLDENLAATAASAARVYGAAIALMCTEQNCRMLEYKQIMLV